MGRESGESVCDELRLPAESLMPFVNDVTAGLDNCR
jgi:hypothetical protein